MGLSEEAIFSFSVHKDHLEYSLKNADSWALSTEIWLLED